MIPDTFFAGFLVAFLALEVVRPFATGFFRRLGIHFGITPSKPTLEDGIDRWLTSLSVRTVGRLYARIRIVRADVKRALEFDGTNPPNERFNFPGRVLLEEVVERLKVPAPTREKPCANCDGHAMLPCPACGGNGEQPDVVMPPVVPCSLAGKARPTVDPALAVRLDAAPEGADELPRPIPNCEHVVAEDGTCGHPDAMTPECHEGADCPPRQLEDETDPALNPRPCQTCNGSGVLGVQEPGGDIRPDPCPACDGDGRA